MKYLGLTRRAANLVPPDPKAPIFCAFFAMFRMSNKSHIARLVEIPWLTFFEEIFSCGLRAVEPPRRVTPSQLFQSGNAPGET